MTREEAIAIIRKEYLCVDRDCDIERNCGKCDLMIPSKEPILEAYKMAIKALEQEPCEDAIDRKLVCAFIAGLISDDGEREKGLEYIRNMPPVNPQPCEDAIDRAEAIKIASGYCHPANVAKELAKLPAVNPQEPRWIPVSERLPEDGQYVMVTFGGKIAVCLAQDNNGALQEVTSLFSKNVTQIWLYPEPEWGDGYAAWMPLPKPYEPQERSGEE